MSTIVSTDKLAIISSDGHANPTPEQWRDYVPAAYLDDYERWLAHVQRITRRDIHALPEIDATGTWDDASRQRQLEGDGIAAEVVFPNFAMPFAIQDTPTNPEHDTVGHVMMNRWLADFCERLPGRRIGHAMAPLHDVDLCVEEARHGREHRLHGLYLKGNAPDLPQFFHPRYEPIWDVCEELEMPVVFHAAGSVPNQEWHLGIDELTDDDPLAATARSAAPTMLGPESVWHQRRVLWQLAFGGVLERHPGLKVVLTESFVDWVPDQVRYLDWLHTGGSNQLSAVRRANCPRLPSEYFREQLVFGASFLSLRELELRDELGVDRLMWGADFPHMESTIPMTKAYLQATFGAAGVSEEDARAMLSENTARVYGFDLPSLAADIDRISFDVDEVLHPERPPTAEELGRNAIAMTRPMGL